MAIENGVTYIYATGMGIDELSSTDGINYKTEGSILKKIPTWTHDSVPEFKYHVWAPDIIKYHGKWYMAYSCSSFGKNTSAIGLLSNKSLANKDSWKDEGCIIASRGARDNWNAIDPNLIVNHRGIPYLTFGSFWDGIQLIRLSKEDYQTPVTTPTTIARRYGKRYINGKPNNFTIEGNDTIEAGENAIEAPFIYKHGKYYYLFVSFDYCCRGDNSTYKTVYGRAKRIEGPYYDKEGRRMDEGGGSYLYGPDQDNYGIGHCSVYDFDGQVYIVAHAYEKAHNGRAKLFIRPLHFDKQGWITTEK
jgi:arabinan endo-1,5-alpha-L-arabinosidase